MDESGRFIKALPSKVLVKKKNKCKGGKKVKAKNDSCFFR